MTAALYADAVSDIRSLLTELDRHPERFQTFSLHVDLAASGNLVVYETKRAKGQTDSLYYGRRKGEDAPRKMTQEAAFAAIDRFFALGEFLALADAPEDVLDEAYPHCGVRFSFRKKGAAQSRSLFMVFIGFNDAADALAYAEKRGGAGLVSTRPHRGQKLFEWK